MFWITGMIFKKWLLATSDYGDEIQEDLNAIVGYDKKVNNTSCEGCFRF